MIDIFNRFQAANADKLPIEMAFPPADGVQKKAWFYPDAEQSQAMLRKEADAADAGGLAKSKEVLGTVEVDGTNGKTKNTGKATNPKANLGAEERARQRAAKIARKEAQRQKDLQRKKEEEQKVK